MAERHVLVRVKYMCFVTRQNGFSSAYRASVHPKR